MNLVTDFVWEFITLFSEMAPFLLLGFLLAGILHVWVPNHLYVALGSNLWGAASDLQLRRDSDFDRNPQGRRKQGR